MDKSRLVERLRDCSISPPLGEWSWEVQRRCYCSTEFLRKTTPGKYRDAAYDLWMEWKQESSELHNDDFLGTCALHLEEGEYPLELEDTLIKVLIYIVKGDYEPMYVEPDTIIKSISHIDQLKRQWALEMLNK